MSAASHQSISSLFDRAARWWRNWRRGRAALNELGWCGAAETAHIARDVGLNSGDLRTLAGKWPDAADLLTQRMAQLALAPVEVTRTDPQAIRDLERVCTLCESKSRCAHDLATNPYHPRWQGYCGNAATLMALVGDRRRPEPQSHAGPKPPEQT